MPNLDYGLKLPDKPVCPVNPGGGLIACGHPVGATGLMQAVFAIWQLQGTIAKHFGDPALQVPKAKRGVIQSHAGTGTYVTVSILESEEFLPECPYVLVQVQFPGCVPWQRCTKHQT